MQTYFSLPFEGGSTKTDGSKSFANSALVAMFSLLFLSYIVLFHLGEDPKCLQPNAHPNKSVKARTKEMLRKENSFGSSKAQNLATYTDSINVYDYSCHKQSGSNYKMTTCWIASRQSQTKPKQEQLVP